MIYNAFFGFTHTPFQRDIPSEKFFRAPANKN